MKINAIAITARPSERTLISFSQDVPTTTLYQPSNHLERGCSFFIPRLSNHQEGLACLCARSGAADSPSARTSNQSVHSLSASNRRQRPRRRPFQGYPPTAHAMSSIGLNEGMNGLDITNAAPRVGARWNLTADQSRSEGRTM